MKHSEYSVLLCFLGPSLIITGGTVAEANSE